MLSKLILFCICALLGTNEAVAQIDLGTYKIINKALQSSLCSDDAGKPIYVSAPEFSCAQELWELGPGDDHDLYTIKNVGSNSFIQANKVLGSSLVTSNMNTSFVILSTEGHGQIIQFPDSAFIWTVIPTTISRSHILLEPESGDITQLWTLIRVKDMVDHRPSTGFSIQARASKEEERTLAFLRGIETLGGSAGYQEYLGSSHTIPNFTHIATLASSAFTRNILATGDLLSVLIYTTIDITAGEYSGKGEAWGIGLGTIAFAGDLVYNSWEELTSAKNGISVVGGGAGANVVLILFSVNGNDIAVLTVAGVGVGLLLGLRGSLTWTHN